MTFLVRVLKNFMFILLLIPAVVQAGDEIIRSFDVFIDLHVDGSYTVKESIVYDFGSEDRHGIYRNIPLAGEIAGEYRRMSLKNVLVTNRSGTPTPFETSRKRDGLEIKIGDPDHLVTGIQYYVISYTVHGGVLYHDEYDEIYWNATGNEWQIPIDQARLRLRLPDGYGTETIRDSECYLGEVGDRYSCKGPFQVRGDGSGRTVEYLATRTLFPGSGMTAAFGLPKGTLEEPGFGKKFVDALIRYGYILFFLVPLGVLVYMWRLWLRVGRDPKGRGTIVPEYEAPAGLTPLEVGTLIDGKADLRDISAEIVYLAVRGHLKIRKVSKPILGVIPHSDYELIRMTGYKDDLGETDRSLLDYLFRYGRGDTVSLTELKDNFYEHLGTLRGSVHRVLHVAKELHTRDHRKVRTYWGQRAMFAAFLAIAASLVFSYVSRELGYAAFWSGVASALILVGFGYFMPSTTIQGAYMKEYLEGLKLYLEKAEKLRLEFHNDPENVPDKFSELLPFAMVLGVEKEWAKQFRNVYLSEQGWYEGAGSLTPQRLVSDMSTFASQATRTVYAAPSSGGASSGGGFSGGGFGGGGGGSW
jgi:uncharacterized membrane protein YgcG